MSSKTIYIYTSNCCCPCYSFFITDFGIINPAIISQINPGNLVNGIKAINFGNIMLRQLNSPKQAITRPNATTYFGKSFISPEETATPAIKRPIGTE